LNVDSFSYDKRTHVRLSLAVVKHLNMHEKWNVDLNKAWAQIESVVPKGKTTRSCSNHSRYTLHEIWVVFGADAPASSQ
jgi:hypothetical protein